ncbi:ORC1-type DNA replication protein 1 [Aeropyrum pernix]|uniref:ORC1-type DNA replication protein n=1 Tax=Aeropyrum pernix TaxID=56636 RepID=A0A401H8F0_AERPX|nr:ORC1-type DNA replication protein 1 [Aeropyrum pernix]
MELADPLEEVFTAALESRIFRKRWVLLPDYVPDELPHREAELRRLAEVLAPALRGEKPSNALLYGLTGTGKTAVARLVLRRLEARASSLGVLVKPIYVNARHRETPYRVASAIAEAVGVRVPFTGLSVGEVYERLVKRLSRLRGIYIVVLDEIDFLPKRPGGQDLLYRITRINQELGDRVWVSLVGITNSLGFVENLEPRVKSSLGEVELVFPPYTAPQLKDILEARAEEAFNPGVLDPDVVPLCAALAAREHGDARRALDLLRVAGEIAERRREDRVRREHVYSARAEIERDRVSEVVRTLPLHAKLVLLSIMMLEDGGRPASTGEIYERYKELTSTLGLEHVTLRRVSGIISELDMLGIVKSRVVSRGRYGKTREVSLDADRLAVENALSEDPFVARLL